MNGAAKAWSTPAKEEKKDVRVKTCMPDANLPFRTYPTYSDMFMHWSVRGHDDVQLFDV